MANTTPFQQPEFIVDIHDDATIPAKLLEQDILARPTAYRDALYIGKLVTTNEHGDIEPREIDGDVIRRITEYFDYKIYRSVEFDETTEDKLAEDTTHSALVHRTVRSQNQHEQAELRKKVAYARLGFFVQQVIEYQNMANTASPHTVNDLPHAI